MSPAEYVELERRSGQKHEYVAGRLYAMAGASRKHNLVCGNLIRALGERLRGRRCAVMPSDQQVFVEATKLATYPDVTVLCGPAKGHEDFPQSLVNPLILVEVLSASTEAYDRGAKFDHYRRIETLREYLLVSTDRIAVDHYLRDGDGTWRLTAYRGIGAQLLLPSVDSAVSLSEIYENIDLVAPEGLEEPLPYRTPVDFTRPS
ncbi:MAG: Uma2 family endonuclease [Polyangiaceae bacterium]